MSKKKPDGRSREKELPPGERFSRSIEWLKKRVVQVEELRREGDPYLDASRTRVELQIRETLRAIFGEQSEEFPTFQNFRIPSTKEQDIDHSLAFLHELILFLEQRRLQAMGIVNSMPPSPSFVPFTAQPQPIQLRKGLEPSLPPTLDDAVSTILKHLTKIGTRFHFVAQQLKLRGDFRPTLEIQDHRDVQDLFGSLLRIEFDEISTEEWVPGEGGAGDRSIFLLRQGQVVILLKKTRLGWGEKEFFAELKIDQERITTHPTCKAVFCFVYDPERRIGNPKNLESQLSSADRHPTFQILIAPA